MAVIDLVVQYTGPFSRAPENLSGDMGHAKVILRRDGEDEVLFTGEEFDPEEFQRRMEARQR
ncbi:MAG: hypothetical protein ABIB97_05390 [Patescibacteria group bacterium]